MWLRLKTDFILQRTPYILGTSVCKHPIYLKCLLHWNFTTSLQSWCIVISNLIGSVIVGSRYPTIIIYPAYMGWRRASKIVVWDLWIVSCTDHHHWIIYSACWRSLQSDLSPITHPGLLPGKSLRLQSSISFDHFLSIFFHDEPAIIGYYICGAHVRQTSLLNSLSLSSIILRTKYT